jgi:threonine dehydratase
LSSRHQAHIFVGIATQSRQDGAALARQLTAAGYETFDLTDNEMAKLHVRHMVGGRAPDVHDERLCRFEFPERPGALTKFLEKLGGRWNISLFHYRNHGSDSGRVLAGFEVADRDLAGFMSFLDELGYPYASEYDNAAYKFFLG